MSEEYNKEILYDNLVNMISLGSFGICFNANDFFNYACADTVIIDGNDLEWVIPIFIKYKWDGINACMAYIAKKYPLEEHITEKFQNAHNEIQKLNPNVHSEY